MPRSDSARRLQKLEEKCLGQAVGRERNIRAAEIRAKIYKEIVKNARITMRIREGRRRRPFKYRLKTDFSLAGTCRLIRNEFTETMWRSAIVKATGRGHKAGPVCIDTLNKTLPDDLARNITLLTQVSFPFLTQTRKQGLDLPAVSLLKFPSLRICQVEDICPCSYDWCPNDVLAQDAIIINGIPCGQYVEDLYHGRTRSR